MKVLLLSLLACSIAATQTLAQSPAQSPAAAKSQQQQAQSPELAEAARLSKTVVQLYTAGKYEEALPHAERALALREKSLGQSDALVADALVNLAAVLSALRKSDRALKAYERAVAIYEATLGPQATATADASNALAWLHYWKKNYDKAEPHFRRALAARERAHGATDPLTADSLSGLAAVHLATADAAKRDDAFMRLLDTAAKMRGPVPRGFIRLFLAYGCTGAGRDSATARQRDILDRIYELWKKKAAEEGGPVEGEVLNGKAISKPAPSYPMEAKQQRVSGTVVVHITVDETGRVVAAEAICGPPLLHDASVQAAWKARFTPTLVDGKPRKVSGTITYNYNLIYSGPMIRP